MASKFNNVVFTYVHCEEEFLTKRDVSFREELFLKELQKCFQTKIHIQKIHLEIIHDSSHGANPWVCAIHLTSPDLDMHFKHTERGLNPTKTVYKAIKETSKNLYRLKDKQHSHFFSHSKLVLQNL
jgi:hypothetical protein